jgi:imidazolonepropionase-like amidohydrolase
MSPIFETLRAMAAAGGRIVAGTDAPIVPYGLGLVLEIEQMSEAGLGPLKAIHSATEVAAEALGASNELGSIRPGRLADLVILDGDPVTDIRNLRRVDGVVSRGRFLKIDHLLEVTRP